MFARPRAPRGGGQPLQNDPAKRIFPPDLPILTVKGGNMKEEEFRKPRSAKEIAWEMFEETGNPTYYMLYKQLKD